MVEKLFFESKLSDSKILDYNPLSLAFLGDGVWGLMVKEFFVVHTTCKNTSLHRLTTKFVKATFQAEFFDKIFDFLLAEEVEIAKRARNVKMQTTAKHASLAEYKKATSFEAVLGYLYLTKNFDRIQGIFDMAKLEMQTSILGLEGKI